MANRYEMRACVDSAVDLMFYAQQDPNADTKFKRQAEAVLDQLNQCIIEINRIDAEIERNSKR